MPYNNTAIPPSDEITGSASLPLARVKRILQIDEDINQCSNNAAFVITIATEMFVRYLAEQAHNVAKSESKPRRNIQYKDLANAVARIDNLEFLSDVVPRTTTYGEYNQRKNRERAERKSRHTAANKAIETGQTTLDGKKTQQNGTNGLGGLEEDMDVEELAMDGGSAIPMRPSESPNMSKPNGSLIFKHYGSNGLQQPDESGDTEMG